MQDKQAGGLPASSMPRTRLQAVALDRHHIQAVACGRGHGAMRGSAQGGPLLSRQPARAMLGQQAHARQTVRTSGGGGHQAVPAQLVQIVRQPLLLDHLSGMGTFNCHVGDQFVCGFWLKKGCGCRLGSARKQVQAAGSRQQAAGSRQQARTSTLSRSPSCSGAPYSSGAKPAAPGSKRTLAAAAAHTCGSRSGLACRLACARRQVHAPLHGPPRPRRTVDQALGRVEVSNLDISILQQQWAWAEAPGACAWAAGGRAASPGNSARQRPHQPRRHHQQLTTGMSLNRSTGATTTSRLPSSLLE